MSQRLPEALFETLENRLRLTPLATLKAAYEALSRDYRVRTVSQGQREDLGSEVEASKGGRMPGGYTRAQARALAYLAARFPATYAAAVSALRQVPDSALAGCESVLDLGAGPGSATWALAQRLPGLKTARLLESNAEMLAHAQAFAPVFPDLKLSFHSGDLAEQIRLAPSSDLVLLAYVLSELDEAGQEVLLQAAWDKAKRGLFLLEPGTPETSRRVLRARDQWTRLGGRVVAPCPQGGACPMDPTRSGAPVAKAKGAASGAELLASGVPPWCHFSVRLERRGLHRAVKGGDLGYEDEKFSWVFFSKEASALPAAPYRLHSEPRRVNRNINLDVCDAQGRRRILFYKRRETAFNLRQAARRLGWGDGWNPDAVTPSQEGEDEGD